MPLLPLINFRDNLLDEPTGQHFVHFYEDPNFLAESVVQYMYSGIMQNQGAIIIARPQILNSVIIGLTKRGINTAKCQLSGQLQLLDAEEALSTFMVDQLPNRTKFHCQIGGILSTMAKSYSEIRAYGEMVDILWDAENREGTFMLEELWSELSMAYPFSLMCGYSMKSFEQGQYAEDFKNICLKHHHTLPSERFLPQENPSEYYQRIAILEQQAKSMDDELKKRKQVESALRKTIIDYNKTNALLKSSENFKNSIIETSIDCIKVLDLESEIRFMNKSGLVATEIYDFNLIDGTYWLDFWQGEERLLAQQAFDEAKAGGIGDFVSSLVTPITKKHKWWHTIISLIPGNEMSMTPPQILAISRDITPTKTLEVDLREAVKTRDDLISMCSHELRTPLTSLSLQTFASKKKIEDGDASIMAPDAMSKMVLGYEKQIDRLIRLVEEMLDVTSITSGKLKMNPEPMDLSELLTEVVDRFSEQLKIAGCKVSLIDSPGIVGVWDKFRLEQVFINLLTNAIKYGKGKPIEIQSSRLPNQKVLISVRDFGIGVAIKNQSRIFQRFERVDPDKEINGLGLGLFIVKQIIDAHNGTISIQSAPDAGSIFTIELSL